MSIVEERGAGLWSRYGGVPLRAVHATVVIQADHAAVVLRQRYFNHSNRSIEAIYTMPLPAGAALSRLTVETPGGRLDGEVRSRDDAARAYDRALASGHGAARVDVERDDVATVSVGNLLPGEEVTVEIEFIEPLRVTEGALRLRLPARVAPRYTPGTPTGERTGYGTSLPTDRAPDADRISPPERSWTDTTFDFEALVDLGARVAIDSPSHPIEVEQVGALAARARLRRLTHLDRDLVLLVQLEDRKGGVAVATAAHREPGEDGYFALTLVPDLEGARPARGRKVALVIDTSGSMEGEPLRQAVAAARLCLRHLRAGDEFMLLAFSERTARLDGYGLRPFDEETLLRADRWLLRLRAEGGTELRAPLVEALQYAHGGSVFLLTDGQVANEDEIFKAARGTGSTAHVFGFGIGTDVCEALLRRLARASGGEVEQIFPGEAIEPKVLAQFSRATAPRIEAVDMILDGVVITDTVPQKWPPLVDGEPWGVVGRYHEPGQGRGLLVGLLDGEPFSLEFALDLPERAQRPALPRVWARAQIGALDAPDDGGEPGVEARERIVELATRHGLATRHTSLLLVERRAGDRLSPGLPEPRVVAIHGGFRPPVYHSFEPRQRRRKQPSQRLYRGFGGQSVGHGGFSLGTATMGGECEMDMMEMERERGITLPPAPEPPAPEQAVLEGQGASGLWGDEGGQVEATTAALWKLSTMGVASDHPQHGAPVRKAIEALLGALEGQAAAQIEAGLSAAWLAAAGPRTRALVREAARRLGREAPTDEGARALLSRQAEGPAG